MSTPPTYTTGNGLKRVNMTWAHRELIPFLIKVFHERPHYEYCGIQHWVKSVHIAEEHLDMIPFYEDFPSTIERLRLALINPSTLTAAERQKFCPIAHGDTQVVSSIFVRHAIRHGTYELYSLGVNPSPDFPRPQQVGLSNNEQQLIDKIKDLETKDQTLSSATPEPAGEHAISSENAGHHNGAPSAPTREQAVATEESQRLLERQRKALAALNRSGTPVQATTMPYSQASQVRQRYRQTRGQIPRPPTRAQTGGHEHVQAPFSRHHQVPAVASNTLPSWPTPQYNQGQWNGGYQTHVAPSSVQHPPGTWNGFPTAHDVPHPNSSAAQMNDPYQYWYPQGTPHAHQGYGTASAPPVQAPHPQPVPDAVATRHILCADANEFRLS